MRQVSAALLTPVRLDDVAQDQVVPDGQLACKLEVQLDDLPTDARPADRSVAPPTLQRILVSSPVREDSLRRYAAEMNGVLCAVETQDLIDYSRTYHPRCVVICGPPGVGKTAMVHRLVADDEVKAMFSDGILFTSVGNRRASVAAILDGWAADLVRLGFQPNRDDQRGTIAAFLREKRVLVVIDDAWKLQTIQDLRVWGGRSAALITTRLPDVAEGLADPTVRLRLSGLPVEQALCILRSHAPDVVEHFPRPSADLMRAIGGLPLGAHIAGAQLQSRWKTTGNMQAAGQFLGELAQGVDALLEAQTPKDVASSQTVNDWIGRSTRPEVLSADLRWRFAAMSVFERSTTSPDLDALSEVWNVDLSEAARMVDVLVSLGLVEVVSDAYRLCHPFVESHARRMFGDLMSDLPELRTVPVRHAVHYANVVRKLQASWSEGRAARRRALERFDQVIVQVRAALEWAIDSYERNEGAALGLSQLVSQCADLMALRSHPAEWARWSVAAIAASRILGHRQAECRCLRLLARARTQLGDVVQGLEINQEAIKLSETLDASLQLGLNLCDRGAILLENERPNEAIEPLERAIDESKRIESRKDRDRVRMRAHGNLGVAYEQLGDFERALRHHEGRGRLPGQLGIARRNGNELFQTYALTNIGWCYIRMGMQQGQLPMVLDGINYIQDRSIPLSEQLGHQASCAPEYFYIGRGYQYAARLQRVTGADETGSGRARIQDFRERAAARLRKAISLAFAAGDARRQEIAQTALRELANETDHPLSTLDQGAAP
jgi:tetratricopeptide (TPR) repeat protein